MEHWAHDRGQVAKSYGVMNWYTCPSLTLRFRCCPPLTFRHWSWCLVCLLVCLVLVLVRPSPPFD